ncbi:hypothetical protein GF376_02310 [Candidatus Peregrinibacteria bacterium]|nr:hypothetical protein [Candidatus Peregrinibacteria bacterium]
MKNTTTFLAISIMALLLYGCQAQTPTETQTEMTDDNGSSVQGTVEISDDTENDSGPEVSGTVEIVDPNAEGNEVDTNINVDETDQPQETESETEDYIDPEFVEPEKDEEINELKRIICEINAESEYCI